MNTVLANFETAVSIGRGELLANTLVPAAPASNPTFLNAIRDSSDRTRIEDDVKYGTLYNSKLSQLRVDKNQKNAWCSVYIAYWRCICAVLEAEEAVGGPSDALAKKWAAAYSAWGEVVRNVTLGYQRGHFEIWTLPCLYVAGKYLRVFAIRADEAAAAAREAGEGASAVGANTLSDDVADAAAEENEHLEDAARRINSIFGLCISDRAPIEESRKWALYNTANLLFKTYFRLNSLSLPKNVLASISSASDVPPINVFPKAHQITFHYYHGVVLFLSEDYKGAESELTAALHLMPPLTNAAPAIRKNHYLILTYLIPCRMQTSRLLPSSKLLASNPALERLFGPVCTAIKRGDLSGFDAALDAGEAEFARRKIYLTLERGRDLCLRNALRKVLLAAGWEAGQEGKVRKSRIPVQDFIAGMRVAMGGKAVSDGMEMESADEERDEVECLLANAIYKGLMKGYIARGPGIVVLSKGGAFPGTDV